jgi:lysophospholipase L1-like esterase
MQLTDHIYMKKLLIILTILILFTSFSSRKDLTWAAIGDSITYLNEHPEETDNRITEGYMTMVRDKLPYIHYTNHGHSGWTTATMANAIQTLHIEKADIYTIFLGTNDWWSGLPTGTLSDYANKTGNHTMYGAYHTIIDKIRSLSPNAAIILISPMQRGDFVYFRDFKNNAWGSYKEKNGRRLSEYADVVKYIAMTENLPLVDLYHDSGITPKNCVKYKYLKNPQTGLYQNYTWPAYTQIPFNPATDEYPYPPDAINMTYDGLHPSDKGMAVIARMLVKVMKRY